MEKRTEEKGESKAQKTEKRKTEKEEETQKDIKKRGKRIHITAKQLFGFVVRKQQNSLHVTLFICKFAKERTLITEKIKKMA